MLEIVWDYSEFYCACTLYIDSFIWFSICTDICSGICKEENKLQINDSNFVSWHYVTQPISIIHYYVYHYYLDNTSVYCIYFYFIWGVILILIKYLLIICNTCTNYFYNYSPMFLFPDTYAASFHIYETPSKIYCLIIINTIITVICYS